MGGQNVCGMIGTGGWEFLQGLGFSFLSLSCMISSRPYDDTTFVLNLLGSIVLIFCLSCTSSRLSAWDGVT